MALQWQNIEIQLSGVDQYTDAPWVVNGKLEQAVNCRFVAPPTIQKRPPFEELGRFLMDGGTPEVSTNLIAHNRELLSIGTRRVYSYAPTPEAWQERGTISECLFTRQTVAFDQSRDILNASIALANNCMVIAWGGTGGTIQGVIIDLLQNSIVNTISFAGTPAGDVKMGAMRAVTVGDIIFLVMSDGVSSTIFYKGMDTTQNNWDFGTTYDTLTVTHAFNAAAIYDVAPRDIFNFYLAYKSNPADGNHPVVTRLTRSGGLTLAEAAVYTTGDVVDSTIAVCGTPGEAAYAAWNRATPDTRKVVLNDNTLAVISAANTLQAGISATHIGLCRFDATHALAIWEIPDALPTHAFTMWSTIDQTTGTVASAKNLPDWLPATKPFFMNDSAFMFVWYKSDIQPTFALIEITDTTPALQTARWTGTAFRGSAHRADALSTPAQLSMLPDVVRNAVGLPAPDMILETALAQRFRVRNAGTGDKTVIKQDVGMCRLSVDAGSSSRHVSCQWGDGRFFAGARPSFYDGQSSYEHGFATYPERYTPGTAGAGAKTWSAVLVYEYLDAQGNVMRSVPSPPISMGPYSIIPASIVMDETLLNSHGTLPGFLGVYSAVRVIPYRTVENPTALPFTYYRAGIRGGSAESTSAVGLREFTDAQLINQELLYNDSDILDNAGTPACSICWTHNGRIWLGGTEDPKLAWFSQPYVTGEQPRFNEALTLNIGTTITAFASMDETLLCFSESAIYVIVGDGPPATGGLDLGFEVATVSTDVGCVEQKSIVEMPTGVMFLSRKGIYHIDRKLQVNWIGLPVKQQTDGFDICTGATLLRETQEVVFAMTATGSPAGGRLIYNYVEDKWSVDNNQVAFIQSGICCAWRDGAWTLVYATTDINGGKYLFQSPVGITALDSEPAAVFQLMTPQIKLNTLQGWQAVRGLHILGRKRGDHGLHVYVDYDNERTFAEHHYYSVATINKMPRYQFRVPCARHKCESVQWLIAEETEDPEGRFSGTSLDIISLVAEGGFMPGRYRKLDPQLHVK